MADSKSSYEEDSSNEAADEAPTGEKRKLVGDTDSNEEDDGGGGDTEKQMKKQKIGFQIGRIGVWKQGENSINTIKKNPTPISIKLGAQKPKENPSVLKATSASVAKAFNPEEDDDDEEMPPEAKMRMRNIGRDTPTSAGPNSFGKTRQGFCDTKKMFERQIKKKLEENSD